MHSLVNRAHRARPSELRKFARHLYRERRLRESVLGDNLFGEATWDILLDLYAAEGEHRPVTVSSACEGSGVPPSTAIRYLTELERRGLAVRERSASDKRAQYVALSEAARAQMTGLLRRLLSDRAKLS